MVASAKLNVDATVVLLRASSNFPFGPEHLVPNWSLLLHQQPVFPESFLQKKWLDRSLALFERQAVDLSRSDWNNEIDASRKPSPYLSMLLRICDLKSVDRKVVCVSTPAQCRDFHVMPENCRKFSLYARPYFHLMTESRL